MKISMIDKRIQKMNKVATFEDKAWCPVCHTALNSINLDKSNFVYFCCICIKYFKLRPTRFNLVKFLDSKA